jgi:hypothetical protein
MSAVQEEIQQQVVRPAKQKKRMNASVKGFVNTPWLLIVVPLVVGGVYLANHLQYLVMAMKYPYALGFLVALIPVVFVIKLVINFFSVIEQWIRLQFEKAKGAKRSQFLEFVIAVFMFVSVCEAGPFFNDAQGHILWNILGYVTVFAFDLVAVVCMRSRAKSLRKGNDKKAFVYELGVWICALVSVYANFYSVSQNLASLTSHHTDWLTSLSPLMGVAFPVMIIFLSYATDSDDDVDDPAIYKKEQDKRVLFLVAKREIATRMHEEHVKLDALKEREFFLKAWLFTRKKIAFVADMVTARVLEVIDQEIATLKANLQRKEQIIVVQVQHIESLAGEVKSLSLSLNEQRIALDEQYRNAAFQMDQIAQIREQILAAHRGFAGSIEQQIDARVRFVTSDLQRQIEHVKSVSVAHLIAVKPENKVDLEVSNTPAIETKESEQITKDLPVNYGLSDVEVQVLTLAFPGVNEWFEDMRPSVSESEVIEVANTRLNSLRSAVSNRTIKPARGRGNKLQTDTVLQWLLTRVKRSANRVRNTGEIEQGNTPSNASVNDAEIPENDEPNTGEVEAIAASNSNSNGHHTAPLNLGDLEPLEV